MTTTTAVAIHHAAVVRAGVVTVDGSVTPKAILRRRANAVSHNPALATMKMTTMMIAAVVVRPLLRVVDARAVKAAKVAAGLVIPKAIRKPRKWDGNIAKVPPVDVLRVMTTTMIVRRAAAAKAAAMALPAAARPATAVGSVIRKATRKPRVVVGVTAIS